MNAMNSVFRSCNLNIRSDSFDDCLSCTCETLADVMGKVAEVALRVLIWIVETSIYLAGLMMRPINWVFYKSIELICSGDASYQGVILDRSAFSLAPERMDLDAFAAGGQHVNVRDLTTEYQRIHGQGANVARRETSRWGVLFYSENELSTLQSLVSLAETPVRLPQAGDNDFEQQRRTATYNQTYFTTLKKVIQNIIVELRNPQIPEEKKKRALMALADGAARCRPRIVAECMRQYRLLRSTGPEVRNLLLEYVQDLKEEILLTYFQDSQFHVLNYMRSRVGEDYGLDTSQLTMEDPFINVGGQPLDVMIHYVFQSQYTTERVVQGVKTRIHLEENNNVWLECIRERLRRDAVARGENLQDEDVADRMGEEATSCFDGVQINERGVILLLKEVGIVVPA